MFGFIILGSGEKLLWRKKHDTIENISFHYDQKMLYPYTLKEWYRY